MFGVGVDGPGHDHGLRAADELRDPPRGHVRGRRHVPPGAGRWRRDHGRRLGGAARGAGPPPRRGGRHDADLPARLRGATSSACATSSDRRGLTARMQVHLVDATYELFRAHFAPRPPVLGRDGINLSGVSGLCDQLLYLLREEGATHVGCATDRVIESFRNDLFPGYKSSAGMPPELLSQFPIAEAAVEALGIVLWPMVEFEADDAIAAAAVRFARRPRGRADPRLHPGQGHGPARGRRPDRALGPAARPHLRRRRRPREMGRAAHLDPGLPRARRRLVGRLSRASPAGAPSRPARC